MAARQAWKPPVPPPFRRRARFRWRPQSTAPHRTSFVELQRPYDTRRQERLHRRQFDGVGNIVRATKLRHRNPDDVSPFVRDRPARIAGLDGRIDLTLIFLPLVPRLAADNALRHLHLQSHSVDQRVAGSEHRLSDGSRVFLREADRFEPFARHFEKCQISVFAFRDDFGDVRFAFPDHDDFLSPVDDMVVCHEVAVARDEETRPVTRPMRLPPGRAWRQRVEVVNCDFIIRF